MTHDEQKAILTIALFAAFADGIKDEREREEVRRIAAALAEQAGTPDPGPALSGCAAQARVA
jgi:tellurite resistance protein